MKTSPWLSAILMVMSLASCRYKDGPKLSFTSAETRLKHVWVIDRVYEDGTDKTSDFRFVFPNWSLDLTSADKNYTLTFNTSPFLVQETGVWELLENGLKINLKKNGTGSNIWTITRLTGKEFWCEQRDGNGKLIQYHLVSK